MYKVLFKRFAATINHLTKSIEAQYGSLFPGILQFIYYGFLRRNRFIVFVHDLETQCNVRIAVQNLVISNPSEKELDDIRNNIELPREFFCDQTYGASKCYLALIDNRPAYIHWVFDCRHSSRFLRIQNGDVEVNYMLTLPDYRRQGLCVNVLNQTVNNMKAEGKNRVFCVVHDRNIASIKAVKKAGFREYTQVTTIGPFNIIIKV